MGKKQLAARYRAAFKRVKRGNESIVIAETDEAKYLVYCIHEQFFNGILPNDWIYETIADVLDSYHDYGSVEDFLCDYEGDIYTNDLLDWMKNSYARGYFEKAKEEGISCDSRSFDEQIQRAQLCAMSDIAYYVDDFLEVLTKGETHD